MNPTEIEAIINILGEAIPALIGAYKTISANISGAPTVDALVAAADLKWAQIQANANAAIAADQAPTV